MKTALALSLALLLSGCAGSARVTRGGGDALRLIQAVDAQARPRIAVGAVIDKTQGALEAEIARLNEGRPPDQQQPVGGVLQGIRDMLITDLFGSRRFIVLERDALDAVLAEQEFSQSAKVGDATRLPPAQLEGAELLVVGAITAFDAGTSGGALPIPLPLGRRGDFGVLNISAKRGYVTMDLRVIDVRSGRVVGSTAVEGRNWRMGLDMTGFFSVGGSSIRLPGLLHFFSNTPVEEALQKMVTAASLQIEQAAH